jgi:hypothetical protein
MSADIVNFPVKRREDLEREGNGARVALIDIAETLPTTLDRPGDAERWADWVLTELWIRGFKAVPLDDVDIGA